MIKTDIFLKKLNNFPVWSNLLKSIIPDYK